MRHHKLQLGKLVCLGGNLNEKLPGTVPFRFIIIFLNDKLHLLLFSIVLTRVWSAGWRRPTGAGTSSHRQCGQSQGKQVTVEEFKYIIF